MMLEKLCKQVCVLSCIHSTVNNEMLRPTDGGKDNNSFITQKWIP